MNYLLDTDIGSYIINQRLDVTEQFQARLRRNDRMFVSTITCYELLFGAARKKSKKLLERVKFFLTFATPVDFGSSEAVAAARIRDSLEARGLPSGPLDILIAACAITSDAILVTNNIRHYENMPTVRLENWVSPEASGKV
ncbi:MAG: type II toxin-antitoxin system VapC family toxin [Acidobacteriota bacterium]|nr:type II toxin-antitoxin system VapC family toxin [Acidobacteriota bacterium]